MIKEDLLYKYFSKGLSPQEDKQLQDLLENDVEFKKQFEFESNLKQAIKQKEAEGLKAKLQGFEKEISNKESTSAQFFESEVSKPISTIFNYKKLAFAASVALLVGWFGYNFFFVTNYNGIYNDNFQEYPNTVYSITRSDTYESLEREAFVAYESSDYKTAIDKLNVLSEKSDIAYLDFYKAQSYLNLNNSGEAKRLFNEVIFKNETFVAESYWYLALINIMEEDKFSAIANLEILILSYDYNKEKAKQLLEKLD